MWCTGLIFAPPRSSTVRSVFLFFALFAVADRDFRTEEERLHGRNGARLELRPALRKLGQAVCQISKPKRVAAVFIFFFAYFPPKLNNARLHQRRGNVSGSIPIRQDEINTAVVWPMLIR